MCECSHMYVHKINIGVNVTVISVMRKLRRLDENKIAYKKSDEDDIVYLISNISSFEKITIFFIK